MTGAAGLGEVEYLMASMTNCPHFLTRTPIGEDGRNERLMVMGLEICRDPPADLSELELAAVWWLVVYVIDTRPALCEAAVELGLFEVGVAALQRLRESSPVEWCVPSNAFFLGSSAADAVFLCAQDWLAHTCGVPSWPDCTRNRCSGACEHAGNDS